MFLLKRGCGALGLDEIAKDIQEKKDNAMAMEFTKCIGELLKKNGVVPKITEVRTGGTFDKDRNVIEERYGVLIEGLDFSEHDKVFEDKIAKLQIKNEHLVDEKNKLREIINKKLGGWDDYGVSFEEIFGMRDENKALKQRIAELESKETEKPTKCIAVIVAKEINGQTYVTLDDFMSVVNDLQAEIGT